MKILINSEIFKFLIILLLISVFGIFYWQTIMSLPLFGDATIHGSHAKILLANDWEYLRADYPPFYYYLMDILELFFGEKGYNLVPYIGFLFLILSTFLFIRQVTKNFYLSALSLVMVGASPKIIYYSARMYQEILITALFIFCIYLFLKFLEQRRLTLLLLLSIFVGITVAIKQQGLFILYPSMIAFFIIDFIRKRSGIKNLLLISLIPLIISIPFYAVLMHTRGSIQPGSDEFKPLRTINSLGRKYFKYVGDSSSIQKASKESSAGLITNESINSEHLQTQEMLNSKLNQIEKTQSSKGFARAENRHVWPTEVFTSFDKFNQANNLYINAQGVPLESPQLIYFSFFTIILGFIYCLRHFNKYSNLLIFSFIFLIINYILFARNTDQQRYHLFIPIYLLCFTFIFIKFAMTRLNINIKLFLATSTIMSVAFFVPVISSRIELNQWWGNSQIYSSSIGGIQSIIETGNWLKSNTPINAFVYQMCGNETNYYSDRHVDGDWRIYFLDKDSLKSYFKNKNISYYVIFQSQIVDDDKWISVCWMPESFYQKMESNFPKVYTSKLNDIFVYETK
jgi:hypothetical protein